MTEQQPQKLGQEVEELRKITLEFYDAHAPGITAFLRSLPPRAETAFIRGLIYQWMLDNSGADDYEDRLMEVLSGPGGRQVLMVPGAIAQSRTPRRPAQRAAPRKKAQTVMPMGDAPRHRVSQPAAREFSPKSPVPPESLVALVSLPDSPGHASSPAANPPEISSAPPSPTFVPPAPVADRTDIGPEGEPEELNPFDGYF